MKSGALVLSYNFQKYSIYGLQKIVKYVIHPIYFLHFIFTDSKVSILMYYLFSKDPIFVSKEKAP